MYEFSDPNFDVVKWINSSLESHSDEPIEPFLASLSMRLHLVAQDYTDQLESGMLESMSMTPRLMSEVTRITEVLKGFEEEMHDLSGQLLSFDQRNVAGVEDLSRLDTLKSNMENCKTILEEHVP